MQDTQLEKILRRVQKPGRYSGGEWNHQLPELTSSQGRVAVCYPDLYEMGMGSYLFQTLYDCINRDDRFAADRTFLPWVDMSEEMRRVGLPLFALDSGRPVADFDVLVLILDCELRYTNILEIFQLAGISSVAESRDGTGPVVVGVGPCTVNPEPIVSLADAFILGDPEATLLELLEVCLQGGSDRKGLLKRAAAIKGLYVPTSHFGSTEINDGFPQWRPKGKDAVPKITARAVTALGPVPVKRVVSFLDMPGREACIEVQRGCGPVCELCEAGDQCQLVLKRSVSEIVDSVGALVDLCGFQEVALEWTGAIDSEWLGGVVRAIRARYPVDDLGLVVAELPLDDYSLTVGNLLGESVRRRGYPVPLLTVNEGRWSVAACTSADFDLISALEKIFEREWNGLSFRVKVGGPGETEDDIRNLVELVSETARVGQRMLGKRPKLRMELDLFSPRAHHQFQAAALNNLDEITNKMDILRQGLRKVGATVICPDPLRWLVQSSLRRGDRRVGKVIHRAWELGCSLESRGQRFDLGRWRQAFEESNLELEVYGCRPYFADGNLPWSHLDFSQRRAI